MRPTHEAVLTSADMPLSLKSSSDPQVYTPAEPDGRAPTVGSGSGDDEGSGDAGSEVAVSEVGDWRAAREAQRQELLEFESLERTLQDFKALDLDLGAPPQEDSPPRGGRARARAAAVAIGGAAERKDSVPPPALASLGAGLGSRGGGGDQAWQGLDAMMGAGPRVPGTSAWEVEDPPPPPPPRSEAKSCYDHKPSSARAGGVGAAVARNGRGSPELEGSPSSWQGGRGDEGSFTSWGADVEEAADERRRGEASDGEGEEDEDEVDDEYAPQTRAFPASLPAPSAYRRPHVGTSPGVVRADVDVGARALHHHQQQQQQQQRQQPLAPGSMPRGSGGGDDGEDCPRCRRGGPFLTAVERKLAELEQEIGRCRAETAAVERAKKRQEALAHEVRGLMPGVDRPACSAWKRMLGGGWFLEPGWWSSSKLNYGVLDAAVERPGLVTVVLKLLVLGGWGSRRSAGGTIRSGGRRRRGRRC
jgi:hypothetical protein